PILKSSGRAQGIHRAFSERRSRHDLSILVQTVQRRSVRGVGILGRDGSARFDFKGVFSFSFDPAKEKEIKGSTPQSLRDSSSRNEYRTGPSRGAIYLSLVYSWSQSEMRRLMKFPSFSEVNT